MKLLARNSVMCLEKSVQDYQSNLATPANLALTSVIMLIFFFSNSLNKSIEILIRATVLLKLISQTITALMLIRQKYRMKIKRQFLLSKMQYFLCLHFFFIIFQ